MIWCSLIIEERGLGRSMKLIEKRTLMGVIKVKKIRMKMRTKMRTKMRMRMMTMTRGPMRRTTRQVKKVTARLMM